MSLCKSFCLFSSGLLFLVMGCGKPAFTEATVNGSQENARQGLDSGDLSNGRTEGDEAAITAKGANQGASDAQVQGGDQELTIDVEDHDGSTTNSQGSEQGEVREGGARPSSLNLQSCSGLEDSSENFRIWTDSDNIDHIATSGNQLLLLKVTGNATSLRVNLKGKKDSEGLLKGICLFITGNQTVVKIIVETKVQEIFVIARGNQTRTEINTPGDGSLALIGVDLQGNNPEVELTGGGEFPCEGASNKSEKSCKYIKQ